MTDTKIRVMHLISSQPNNFYGGDIAVLNIVRHLDKERYIPIVASFAETRHADIPFLIKEAQNRGIAAILIPCRGRFDYNVIGALRRILIDQKIDVIHCHGYKADIIGCLACRFLPVKKIATIHGWWVGRSIKLRLYDIIDAIALRGFDRVIAVSSFLGDSVKKKGIADNRVMHIPNGVDCDAIEKADGSGVRAEFKLSADDIVVGTVGRLSKEKGQKYLLAAVKEIPDITVMIVGAGPLGESLIRHARELGIADRVIFTGFRTDIYDFLAAFDIFALPSLSEGMPLSLLEAMAAGKPVVATQVGGIPAVMKNRETGILIAPGNTGYLVEAIRTLLKNPDWAKDLGAASRREVRTDFSVVSIADRYAAVYGDIIRKP